MIDSPVEQMRNNPFFVLEVTPQATAVEVERAAQRWLALLEVGGTRARTFETPFGPAERTVELVRQSLAALRIPQQRALFELLSQVRLPAPQPGGQRGAPWPEAAAAIGWNSPWPQ